MAKAVRGIAGVYRLIAELEQSSIVRQVEIINDVIQYLTEHIAE